MFRLLVVGIIFLLSSAFTQSDYLHSIRIEESNSYLFDQVFTQASTTAAIRDIEVKLKVLPANTPFYLLIYSPGGSVIAGLELIRYLNAQERIINTITLRASSMGFHTAQGIKGDRYILPDGVLMSHRARGGVEGEYGGELDSRLSFDHQMLDTVDKNVVKRTKGKHTLESYRALISDEYRCFGENCVTEGFADYTVSATCGASFNGTRIQDLEVNFFGMALTVSVERLSCPLVTGVLSAKLKVGDKDAVSYFSSIENPKRKEFEVQALQKLLDKYFLESINVRDMLNTEG